MRKSILPMLAALLTVSLATATVRAAEGADVASGIWAKHKIQFNYLGFTSTYSCDGLQDKLRLLLRAAGARDDMKIVTFGCPGGFGRPSRFAAATLTFYTLKPATAGAADQAGSAVAAKWRKVRLAPHQPNDLMQGDCELIEQFRDRVLPLFATRDAKNYTHCIPYQATGGSFNLQFQSLVPMTAKG
jgi:hypothetical protein